MRLFIYFGFKNLLFILERGRQVFLKYIIGFFSYISQVFRDTLDSYIFFSGRRFFLFNRNIYLFYIEISLDEDNNDRLYWSRDTRV